MTVHRTAKPVPKANPSPATGPFATLRLSDLGGLTQFGAFLQELPPGSRTSIKHWHEAEDELVHVICGTPTLLEGDSETLLNPGDSATFKTGVAVGHTFENRSAEPVRLLVIGTRETRDRITYPDAGIIMTKDRSKDRHDWTDLSGHPVENPYA